MTFPHAWRAGIGAAVLALVAGATSAQALPPLRDNAYINERLLAAQIGDLIQKACPTISARDVYATYQAYRLKRYANGLGYSDRDINAFVKSKDEKKRVKDAAIAYMAAKGVVEGDAESYCILGRDEIARNTITGSLLKSQ